MLFQRLFIAAWLLVGLVMMYVARTYQAPFSYEPVGPRAFPWLMLALMCIGLTYLLIKPTPIEADEDEPAMTPSVVGKVLLCIVMLLGFAAVFEPLGFIPSAALVGIALAKLYGGRWVSSAITSVLLSIGLYILFDRLLDVPLPLGILSGMEI